VPLRKGFTEESVPSKTYTILSAARPLIASVDAGSEIWRLVEEAACGLCVEPENPEALAEAVIHLSRNRQLGYQMGSNGRAYVEKNYSRRGATKRYEQLFMKVISERA
jgi:colanic acid biosynthesis glycosyl transferase WcaI